MWFLLSLIIRQINNRLEAQQLLSTSDSPSLWLSAFPKSEMRRLFKVHMYLWCVGRWAREMKEEVTEEVPPQQKWEWRGHCTLRGHSHPFMDSCFPVCDRMEHSSGGVWGQLPRDSSSLLQPPYLLFSPFLLHFCFSLECAVLSSNGKLFKNGRRNRCLGIRNK